ncbi:MAG: 3-dehydroquinate synthase [Candidatus Marinimicrobia bacterium]|nr:3-dehydroquinate synthase [Candidatus Neomarinimicrobiota bacterium]
MQNIILIGFMGSGKDSVGQAIARLSGLTFLSTDRMIEMIERRSISDIFENCGEAYFRHLEKNVLKAIRGLQNIVLATGGGIVKDENNRKRLSQLGHVVCLKVTAEMVRKRTDGDTTRPLLKQSGAVEKLLKERAGIYKFANIAIDTNNATPDELAETILRQISIDVKPTPTIDPDIIPVKTVSGKYNVIIGSGILESLPQFIDKRPKRYAIITNPLVGGLVHDRVRDILSAQNVDVFSIVIPDGERYKSLKTVSKIYDSLLESRFDRDDMVIGLGGGVITDIAGFVAATLKRGCRLVNIPTTLLSQVDASVGGKTGVNHSSGKNLIGSFYQPELVLADSDLLQTLPDREFRNGLAEAIKAALIRDPALVDFLTEEKDAVLHRDRAALQSIVRRCIEIKRDIVEQDEKEISGVRSLLNFGHTVGHMIEAGSHYRGVKHGEAVAIGMALEARIGSQLSTLDVQQVTRIENLIRAYQLPVTIPGKLELKMIRQYLLQDKKIRGGRLKLPVLMGIGKSKIEELTWDRFVSYMDQI